jgi:hypothetical protein
MSNRSDRDRHGPSSSSSADPYEEPATVSYEEPATVPYEESATVSYEEPSTVPYMEAAPDSSGNPSPRLRQAPVAERKNTLRDLAVPAPNRQPTLPYMDRLPPSDPPPPPAVESLVDGSEDPTQLRISTEPVTFYIERDSIPAPSDPDASDAFDSSPTRPLPTLDEATTQIKANQRPSAMNLGKLASPRFGGAGEPVRIATGKPSAMRLNRVEALLDLPSDATTDAPVETPTELARNSLSGQRLHRALPILTGVAFVAIGAAITVTLLRAPAKVTAPAPTTTTTLSTTATLAPRIASTLPAPASSAPSQSSLPAPTPAPTTPPAAAESAPVVAPASPPTIPPTPPTRRKQTPRPSSPPSPPPKKQSDGLGDLPF